MSLFITFEGGEGSGKSTQAAILVRRLRAAGRDVSPVHEPGTTELGEHLRELLKRESSDDRAMSPEAELLLFAAARAELVERIIRPALAQPSSIVVADRYADSSVAYQAYGRGLDPEQVRAVNTLATGGVTPHLTILLDCPAEAGLGRIEHVPGAGVEAGRVVSPGRVDPEGTRRFENESVEFHRRVRDGYLELARREPERWLVLDALGAQDEIADSIWDRVEFRLDPRPIDQSGEEPQA